MANGNLLFSSPLLPLTSVIPLMQENELQKERALNDLDNLENKLKIIKVRNQAVHYDRN
jgi:hypothetical protein